MNPNDLARNARQHADVTWAQLAHVVGVKPATARAWSSNLRTPAEPVQILLRMIIDNTATRTFKARIEAARLAHPDGRGRPRRTP